MAAGIVVTAVIGSLVQTQINLMAITKMGVPISPPVRLATTGEDLVGFGPVMALIATAAFLPAMAGSALVGRIVPHFRVLVSSLAGLAGLWAAFTVMGLFTPMPTLVAAVRGPAGLAAMCASGLIGGALYGLLLRSPAPAASAGQQTPGV